LICNGVSFKFTVEMKLKYLVIFLLGGIYLSGCKTTYSSAPVPTYVHIDSFSFSSNPGDYAKYGSISHSINYVWAFYNNNPVGVFQLPVTFPIITSGSQGSLLLEPGITINGLTSFETPYPFYTADTSTLITNPGKIKNTQPITGYNQAATMRFIDDFEFGTQFTRYSSGSPDSIVKVTDPSMVYEGKGAGYIDLKSTADSSEIISQKGFPMPAGDAYLEINYKCSVPFYIGGAGTDANGDIFPAYYLIGIRPSDTWKKLYVSLQTLEATYTQATTFYITIKTSVPSGQTSGYVLLDNIKVFTDPD